MIAKDAVVTVAGTSEVESQSSAIAKLTGITSDTLSALKDGADDGQRINGKRKGVAND